MRGQLTSPGGEASPQGTPCPRSRDGLPDQDDVRDTIRPGWAMGPRVHAPLASTRLVSRLGTVPTNSKRTVLEAY